MGLLTRIRVMLPTLEEGDFSDEFPLDRPTVDDGDDRKAANQVLDAASPVTRAPKKRKKST